MFYKRNIYPFYVVVPAKRNYEKIRIAPWINASWRKGEHLKCRKISSKKLCCSLLVFKIPA